MWLIRFRDSGLWRGSLCVLQEFFENPAFRPDGLKLYPTLVIRGTGLYELWKTGRYKSYTPSALVDLVARILALVPPWTRVYRVQRWDDEWVGCEPSALFFAFLVSSDVSFLCRKALGSYPTDRKSLLYDTYSSSLRAFHGCWDTLSQEQTFHSSCIIFCSHTSLYHLSGTSPCRWWAPEWSTATWESWRWPGWRTWALRWDSHYTENHRVSLFPVRKLIDFPCWDAIQTASAGQMLTEESAYVAVIESDDRLKNLPRIVKHCWSGGPALPPSHASHIYWIYGESRWSRIHPAWEQQAGAPDSLSTQDTRQKTTWQLPSQQPQDEKTNQRTPVGSRAGRVLTAGMKSGAGSALLLLVCSLLSSFLSHDSLLKTTSGITCELSSADGDFVFVLSRRRDVFIIFSKLHPVQSSTCSTSFSTHFSKLFQPVQCSQICFF